MFTDQIFTHLLVYRVLVFRETPTLAYTGLTAKIGEPRVYEENLDDADYFDKEIDLSIPLEETNEYVAPTTPAEVSYFERLIRIDL